MDFETIAGVAIIVVAVAINLYLVLWSRRAINRIADKELNSARDIVRDLRDGG